MSRFTESMFLANLKTRTWYSTRLDQEISAGVAHDKDADADAVSTHRVLVPHSMLANVRRTANRTRTIYMEHTSPWMGDGTRVLPARTASRFAKRINEAKTDFETAVDKFLARYDAYVEDGEAERRMGNLFMRDDFPATDLLRDSFGCELTLAPMPDAADWRIDVIEAETANEIREEYAAKLSRLEDETRDYWLDAYQTLLERAVNGLQPKRILRSSTIEKLGRLAQSIAEGAIHLDPADVAQSANRVVDIARNVGSARPNSPERIAAANELARVLVNIKALQENDR